MVQCDECGELYLVDRGDQVLVVLVELEDQWGVWQVWLCNGCLSSAWLDEEVSSVTVFDFLVEHKGA